MKAVRVYFRPTRGGGAGGRARRQQTGAAALARAAGRIPRRGEAGR